ncbi:MAG: AAA family ATPase [Janthinobacterium lividum]
MWIVAVTASKGGTGKTFLSTELAVIAAAEGLASLVLDVDPQASALAWADRREGLEPQVMAAQASRLGRILDGVRKQGADIVFIDTGPADPEAADAAARIADIVLVPTRASARDLDAIEGVMSRLRLVGTRRALVLNAVPPTGSVTAAAMAYIKEANHPLAPIQIAQRADFTAGLGVGKVSTEWSAKGKGASEIRALWTWLRNELKNPSLSTRIQAEG